MSARAITFGKSEIKSRVKTKRISDKSNVFCDLGTPQRLIDARTKFRYFFFLLSYEIAISVADGD